MANETKKEVLVVKESLIQSIISDFLTFFMLASTAFVNGQYIHNNFLSFLLWIIFLTMFFAKLYYSNNVKKAYNKEDSIKLINELFDKK